MFFLALVIHLNTVQITQMSPPQIWDCRISGFCFQTYATISTLLVLCMIVVFDRLYSIVKPHKAASFNTFKRVKITILCVTAISVIYNVPNLFVIISNGRQCSLNIKSTFSVIYYWMSNIFNFGFIFCSLLTMNCVIIPGGSSTAECSKWSSSACTQLRANKMAYIIKFFRTFIQ